MNMVIQSFDNLHDNRVLRYCADFEAHSLHMDTQAGAGEKVSLHFTGLLGGTISYGFPACCSIKELRVIYPPGDCPATDGYFHWPENQGTGVV